MIDMITDYGFLWGPMEVLRVAHVEGRGYVVEVRTEHAKLQVYVTEKGRRVEAYRPSGGKMLEPE